MSNTHRYTPRVDTVYVTPIKRDAIHDVAEEASRYVVVNCDAGEKNVRMQCALIGRIKPDKNGTSSLVMGSMSTSCSNALEGTLSSLTTKCCRAFENFHL